MYSIHEVSQKTGLTTSTLRYYEKEGLITGVERNNGGIRQYSDQDLEKLGLICCLKNTGMSIQEIAHFVKLTSEGEHTLEERVEMLRKHREKVMEKIVEMQRYCEKVTWKYNYFMDRLNKYRAQLKDTNNKEN